MSNNKHSASTQLNDNDYDTLVAVEQVFSTTAIDVIECVNVQITIVDNIDNQTFNPQQAAANDSLAGGDNHSMNCVRMAEYDETLKQRANKSQLNNYRSLSRQDTKGESEPD